MAVLRACSSKAAVGGARSRASVVVTCQKGENRLVEKVQVAAASFAAAALLTVSPANAGVVLEQPQLKKLFIDTTPAAPAKPASKEIPTLKTKNAATSAPAPKAEEKKAEPKKAESEGAEGADLDIRAVALPGALAFVVGAYFALTKLDSGFADFVYNTAVRDSNSYAGFEPALKTGNGTVIGTKKVKATKKK